MQNNKPPPVLPPLRHIPSLQERLQHHSLKPQDATSRWRAAYGYSLQTQAYRQPAPQRVQRRPPSSPTNSDLGHLIPSQQSRYMMDPHYRRLANETIAMMHNGEVRPTSPPPRPFTQPLPPPPPPLIAYDGSNTTRPTSPPQEWITHMPTSRPTSAPAPSIRQFPAAHSPMRKPGQATSCGSQKIDWRKLPPPVVECILSQLRTIHLEPQSRSCDTCHMRDVTSLQLSCRAWSAHAQKALYSKIAIIGADTPSKLKRFKVKTGVRLILLRRTLRARPLLASFVKTLQVPDPMFPIYLHDGRPNLEYDDYLCLLASVVMCCPELEIFTGFNSFYNHTFDRLTHALSTRPKLRQHVWVIAENVEVMARSKKKLPPGLLDGDQVYQFRQYHLRWSQLETLMLCSPASLGVVEHDLFVDILRNLPSLRSLCVSSFDADDFNDATLLELPGIRSLRVEECEGVSDAGLAKWATCPSSILIEDLALIHQNLTNLATISKLFSGLEKLKKLTIVQSDVSPTLPLDVVVCQPLFSSPTVERIHWDIGENVSASTKQPILEVNIEDIQDYERGTPNTQLAQSILRHGFPALKSLRAPRDTSPPGALQSVCRPAKNGNTLLPADSYSTHRLYAPRQSNSLQAARIRAQNLVEESMKSTTEYMKILVTDHTPDEQSTSTRPSTATGSRGSSGLSTWMTSMATTEPETTTTPLSAGDVIRLAKEKRDKMILLSRLSVIVDSDESTPPQSTQLRHSYKLTRPPMKIHEFSLPKFMGRVSTHTHISEVKISQPPLFDLIPDVVGRDANGGIASWGELLRIKERVRVVESEGRGEEWVRDGCVGRWNKGRGYDGGGGGSRDGGVIRGGKEGKRDWREGESWRHTEREKGRRGVGVEDFFC